MEAKAKYYFYVLECNDLSLYAGFTNNLDKRVACHNQGKGAKCLRGKRPVKLKYFETYETKSEAMSAEARFKKLTRQAKLAIVSDSSV